ncbi:MAG: vitamin B12-dependent ribonucleotide reductase, partial [Dehalococcoidia bacterium]|nr:vitamin B12-dependent ribonucleotide reductase [Dehalococcoidia bacterium]
EQYEGLTVFPTGLDQQACPADLLESAHRAWDRAVELGERHGYRNAQSTLIAPTGTIGLLMDCDTTGVEPDFALVKFKKLAGGGYFRIINQSVPPALKRLGYSQQQIHEIVEYAVGTQTLDGAPYINRMTLAQKGFTQPALDMVENALKTAFHISFVFNRWTLGDEFCTDTLGIPEAELTRPGFDMLGYLGFTREQVETANDAILGRMTTEGAPHLAEEHYAVFDCANKCGKYGQRFIEPMAHVRILAAAQPFLSGAISKTINMPMEATVEEVKEVYMAAADTGVKALALYRDGSKLSQPLSGTAFADIDEYEDETEEVTTEAVIAAAERMLALKQSEQVTVVPRGERIKMPDRRSGYTQKAKVGGHTIYIHTGEYKDGQLGEVFVDTAKDGAAFRSLMNCFAIAVSMGLQYGVPLEKFVDTFVFTKFEPMGMVQGNDRIKFSSSIIDYIFRELAVAYLGRDDLAHVTPEELEASTDPVEDSPAVAAAAPAAVAAPVAPVASAPAPAPTAIQGDVVTPAAAAPAAPAAASTITLTTTTLVAERTTISATDEARQKGFEGDPCDECGQLMMVRNGTCLKCMNCGATSGCS